MNDRPVAAVDYSVRKCTVWSCDATSSNQIRYPMQLVIEDTTQNIFIADYDAEGIQVFNEEGNHLYQISTPPCPIGLVLTDNYIFVSTEMKLVKIESRTIIPSNQLKQITKSGELTLTVTQTFMDVSLSANQLSCLMKILNS